MRIALGATALAGGLIVAVASPALAHEEITPNTVTVGAPTFMTIAAANEQKVALTKLEVRAPKGISIGLTRAPNGWTAESGATQATFTGRLAPEHFEQFGFEIEGADQPGTAAFTAVLTFAGAKTETVTIPVTVVAAGTSPATSSSTAAEPEPKPSASVSASVGPSASSMPSTNTAATTSTPSRVRASTHDNRALAVAILALLAALAAMAVSLLRRLPTPAGGAGTRQDW